MVAIWKGDKCEKEVDREIWKMIWMKKSKIGFQRYNKGNRNPIQDQPKWWRAGEDLKGTMKMKEDPIQDQPKWWRVGRI